MSSAATQSVKIVRISLEPQRRVIAHRMPHAKSLIPALSQIRTMSHSISTLQRLSAKSLAEKILEEKEATDPTFAVIDVRDDDHLGGHIKGSTNVPSRTLDAMMPTLVRRLKDKETVVFHCMLSQQRGPSAALKYLRQRDTLLKTLADGETAARDQKVYVLDHGFTGWQRTYGPDERLTEGYSKELWEDE
ncbi:phosphatase-like protein [Paramyrothecium foliicola]|nr:phosphatase-like protein [Paramyrothecium foliicola]